VPRSLIVNADDFGLTAGVNNGILDAHDRGILTSASLFANAPATTDAIRRAHFRPSLGVGVHLTLVDGAPTLPPIRVPSLVEDDGRFRSSWKPFIVACLRGHVVLDEVEKELTAQIDRIRADGVRLTHLDTHKHIHGFPPIFTIVARLAHRFRIPAVRVPYERWSRVWGDGDQRHTARQQRLANAVMLPWAMRDYRAAAALKVQTPRFVGRAHTGVMSAESLEASLRRLGPGVTELMVHPGYVDAALRQTPTRLLSSRDEEVALLSAATIRDVINDEGIQLIRHGHTPSGSSATRSFRHVS
jgi:hopanoid biosynthesis associated protein HpnK